MDCELYDIWRKYEQPDILFCLNGPISQDLLVEICDTVAHKLRLDNTDNTTMMKIHATIVELSQNIIRYSAEKVTDPRGKTERSELGLGIIAVGCHNNRYIVTSGNLIENIKIPPLERLLNKVHAMSPKEIQKFFLDQRKNSPPSGSGGAGLGIIEVSRKAGEPLCYEFRPVDKKFSFFCIKVVI
jgi:hypothetical protein